MLNVKSEMRHAIFKGDERVTDFCWTDTLNMGACILVHNDEKLAIYDTDTGEVKLCIDFFAEYKLYGDYLFIKSKGVWGVFTTHGEMVVPMEYDYINECIYSNGTHKLLAVSVDTGFEDGGYYIVNEKKYYAAEEINITQTNKIELKINDEWIILNDK